MVSPSKKSGFVAPSLDESKAALGTFSEKDQEYGEYLRSLMDLFEPIPQPGPGDWLACHKEAGETFEAYSKGSYRKVTEKKKVIYLQPLEKIVTEEMIKTLEKFLGAYFADMIVKVNPYIYLEDEKTVTSRINSGTQKKQYNGAEILEYVLLPKIKDDAYCTIGCTMTDLYPQESWNFVFGLASPEYGIGAFSFARYDENFFLKKPRAPTDPQVIIYRAAKVMAHEIGHMFGLPHCIYLNCLMNGSNNLEETNLRPIEYCPICIRKLQSNIGFDLVKRYEGLLACFKELGGKFEDDIKWYEKALSLAKKKETQ